MDAMIAFEPEAISGGGVAGPPLLPPDYFKGFRPPLNLGRCGEQNLRLKDKR